MPPTGPGTRDTVAAQLQRDAMAATRDGLLSQTVEAVGDDGTITIRGRRLANFGSCSYLGLWGREELKRAAIEGIEEFGVHFSSSRLYASLPYYPQLEDRLGRIFDGAHGIATGTTTLGHLSALPSIIADEDAILIDRQAHSSLRLAASVLAARRVPIRTVEHADLADLEEAVADLSPSHQKIWYVADGVYSMFGDRGPNAEVIDLLDDHPQLHAYIDDAHGFAWAGRHGRGVAVEDRALHPRLVLALSFAKAFGATGGAIVAADPVIAQQVAFRGGPLMFGGPIQTADLAAAVAAADLLLSDAHEELRARIEAQIDLVIDRARAHGLVLTSTDRTPIWFVETGSFDRGREVGRRMVEAGFWVNLSSFPVVPMGRAGIRFTNTLAQSDDQIDRLLETLAAAVADVGGGRVIDLTDAEAGVDGGAEAARRS
ncbi:aminotransferase class I/II-fold pyridoxal phosphate-dependent enzyme [Euzebya sp.]|uniref:aminotransferase class I/II-fold pyridoxal phosphate-dependent enzyme n=1 Tax=Euzebya sp. TaxID=1971409 RepID=UPI0035171BC5